MMDSSILTVTTAATDLALLTLAELRAAVGISDGSKDPQLQTIGDRVAARLAAACRVPAAGTAPPTLRQETLTETFRQGYGGLCPVELLLARRPVVSVTSVTEDDVAVAAGDYEILASAGSLRRLCDDAPTHWLAAKTVVVYVAGWATVPDGLKRAAEELARQYYFEGSRDPAAREVEIPGVIRRSYWVGSASEPDIPQSIMDALMPYKYPAIG